jgi:hypothetical protein
MSKISRLVTNTVTLGTAGYLNPLTITTQGTIAPGGIGIVVPANYTGATIVNYGNVGGRNGYFNYSHASAAIYSASNLDLSNQGIIHGGIAGFWGSSGGMGVDVSGAAIVNNSGQITGGGGAYGTYGGGSGATALDVTGSLTLTNTGSIQGGYGGASEYYPGAGGAGVDVTGTGNIVNRGTILGGAGGQSYLDGSGVILTAGGTVVNSGLIGVGVGLSGRGRGQPYRKFRDYIRHCARGRR